MTTAFMWWMKSHRREAAHTIVFGPLVIERVFASGDTCVSVIVKGTPEAAILDALGGTDMREKNGLELQAVYAVRDADADLAYSIRSLYDLRDGAEHYLLDKRTCEAIAAIEMQGEVLHRA